MEELKVIMEALVKMSDGTQTVFLIWCLKEIIVYLVCPLTFFVIGKMVCLTIRTQQEWTGDQDQTEDPEWKGI